MPYSAPAMPDHHQIFHDQRRDRGAISFLDVIDLGFPQEIPGLGIQRHQLGFEIHFEELVAERREATIHLAAADTHSRRQRLGVVPHRPPGGQIQPIRVIRRTRRIHHSVVNQRSAFELAQRSALEDPLRRQIFDSGGIDLAERAIAPPGIVLPVHQPVGVVALRLTQLVLRNIGGAQRAHGREYH